MGSEYTQYPQQWNPWGQQAPPDYPQVQQGWQAQPQCYGWQAPQPDYGWQTQQTWPQQQPQLQQPWNMQQAWDALQPQQPRNPQPGYYEGQHARSIWPEDLESLIAAAEEPEPEAIAEPVPEVMPQVTTATAQTTKKQPSKAVNLVLNILTICFVAFLITGSTVFAFSNSKTKNLFGYRFYNVLTPSMQPMFKPGDMIFVKLADPSNVKVGDVVTFNPSAKSDAFLTHRVTELLPADEKHPERMITQGDFNNAADPPVNLSAVIGVHKFTIPAFGKVVDMMRNNLLLVCICFGAIFLLLTVMRAYFAARKQEKSAAQPSPALSSPGLSLPSASPALPVHGIQAFS